MRDGELRRSNHQTAQGACVAGDEGVLGGVDEAGLQGEDEAQVVRALSRLRVNRVSFGAHSPGDTVRVRMALRRDRPHVPSAATTAKGVAGPIDGLQGPPLEKSSGLQPRKRGRPRKAGVEPVAARVDAPRQVEQSTHA
eukprot:jgi/Tetstr1/457775/TSEL_044320.t1